MSRPSIRYAAMAWTAVAVLVLAYAVSFVDRQVVALLVEPLKAQLGLSDSQIGLIQGPAFGIFYGLFGLPLGMLADRVHRVRLITVGILLWSAATAVSGFATSFGELFVARIGVGIGEAALVPAAVSLIADLFPAQRRALPMSVLTAGASMGAGLSLLLGGWFVAFATHGVEALPMIGSWLAARPPWQVVFMLAGMLGIPVAIAILCVSEPERGRVDIDSGGTEAVDLKHLVVHWRLYGPLFAGTGLLYIFTNAFSAWMPSLFIRQFHWLPSQVGTHLGVPIMICAVCGSVCSGLLATWIARRRASDAPLRTMLIGGGLLAPIAILVPLSPSLTFAVPGIVASYFAVGLCFGVATAAFVGITPSPLRGRVVAIYLLVGNLVGLGLGPYVVGALLDHVLRSPQKVGSALSIVATCTVVPGLLLWGSALRRYRTAARGLVDSHDTQTSSERAMPRDAAAIIA